MFIISVKALAFPDYTLGSLNLFLSNSFHLLSSSDTIINPKSLIVLHA